MLNFQLTLLYVFLHWLLLNQNDRMEMAFYVTQPVFFFAKVYILTITFWFPKCTLFGPLLHNSIACSLRSLERTPKIFRALRASCFYINLDEKHLSAAFGPTIWEPKIFSSCFSFLTALVAARGAPKKWFLPWGFSPETVSERRLKRLKFEIFSEFPKCTLLQPPIWCIWVDSALGVVTEALADKNLLKNRFLHATQLYHIYRIGVFFTADSKFLSKSTSDHSILSNYRLTHQKPRFLPSRSPLAMRLRRS